MFKSYAKQICGTNNKIYKNLCKL
ncbi:Kazal-type serine protease inhibitor domain-containing protein [Helicobacter cetorum]